MATLAGGSARPPDSAARALPGARYSAPKIAKLATSRLPISIASRRARNRTVLIAPLSLSAEAVGPRREHEGERADRAGQAGVQDQYVRRLRVRDPRQLLRRELLGLGDEPRPRVRVRGAAGLLEQRGDLRVVEVVVVLRPARQGRGGQQRGRVGVVAVVHR